MEGAVCRYTISLLTLHSSLPFLPSPTRCMFFILTKDRTQQNMVAEDVPCFYVPGEAAVLRWVAAVAPAGRTAATGLACCCWAGP